MTTENKTVALYILNRLALAVIAILRFHADKPVIAAFTALLLPKAEQFTASYTRVGVLKADQAAQVRASNEATAALYHAMMSWLWRVVSDLPDVEPRDFGSRQEVTLDVLTSARRLMQTVQARGETLSYAQVMLAELHALVDAAQAAYDRAQDTRRTLQSLRTQTRELGADLHRNLIAFRRAVRATLGPSHVDSQRLRSEQGRSDADDDADEVSPEAQQPPVPAPMVTAPALLTTTTPANGHSRPPSLA